MSERHRNMLSVYKAFRASPPTVGSLARRLLPTWLLLVALCGLWIAVSLLAQVDFLAWAAPGFLIGALARDLGYCLKTALAWPTINAIVDWNRVDDLLAHDP
jgi:hypothetical protein